VSRALPPGGWSVAARIGLGLLWPALLWQLGLVSPGEKEYLRGLLRELAKAARAGKTVGPAAAAPDLARSH
jgi:hypothetical protein